jgi:two-component system, LytTR family, sensor histidine kinase AlgZ
MSIPLSLSRPHLADAEPPMTSASFLRAWRHDLTHASRGYWIAQAFVGLGHIGFSLFLLGSLLVNYNGPSNLYTIFLKNLLGMLLLLVVLHMGVRPVLRHWFLRRSPAWYVWLAGLAWLLALACAHTGIEILAMQWLPDDSWDVRQIHFEGRSSQHDLHLSLGWIVAIASINQWVVLTVWSVLYLAWKAFESRRLLQQQVRQARMQQLTHQLSPHFLFNAFNTIRALIFEDRARAAELVTELSELFRFHLGAELRVEQSLAEEWALARRYLALEAPRLEARLSQQIALDPDCLERHLPALTVLTLVENAIKHGVAPNREGGWLRLTAAMDADGRHWRLQAANSIGAGRAAHGAGCGLANLRERLALQFADRAQLRIEEHRDTFVVVLELPA